MMENEVGTLEEKVHKEVQEQVMEDLQAEKAGPIEERPYPCKICGRRFKLALHLGRHMTTIHKEKSARQKEVEAKVQGEKAEPFEDKPYQCEICGQRFKRPQGLGRHRSTIHKEKSAEEKRAEPKEEAEESSIGLEAIEEKEAAPARVTPGIPIPGVETVKCPECGLTFTKQGLAAHMSRNHGKGGRQKKDKEKTRYLAKTVPCPICGRRVGPQGLPNHMRMHEREGKGPELKALIIGSLSQTMKQILEQIPKIVDEFSKNDELLLQAFEKNGWQLKVKEPKLIILVKP